MKDVSSLDPASACYITGWVHSRTLFQSKQSGLQWSATFRPKEGHVCSVDLDSSRNEFALWVEVDRRITDFSLVIS